MITRATWRTSYANFANICVTSAPDSRRIHIRESDANVARTCRARSAQQGRDITFGPLCIYINDQLPLRSLPISIALVSLTLHELGHFWTWVTLCVTLDNIFTLLSSVLVFCRNTTTRTTGRGGNTGQEWFQRARGEGRILPRIGEVEGVQTLPRELPPAYLYPNSVLWYIDCTVCGTVCT
jgi:hypothetical protein